MSKTDLAGRITYANRTFMRVSNYTETELLGKPHNILRHKDMPAGVFYGLWQTLRAGKEFFGFVKNRTSDGNYYWVFANVTPDVINGNVVGFYSVRRFAPPQAVSALTNFYTQMHEQEQGFRGSEAARHSWHWLLDEVNTRARCDYDEFVLNLYLKFTEGAVA